MSEKCKKYETLFTFADERTLKKHLALCEDCRDEQKTMDRVSDLIKEVKPYFKQKKKEYNNNLIAACILFALVIGGASAGVLGLNPDITDTVKYGTTLSAEDLGFPVDSYGLLMVE